MYVCKYVWVYMYVHTYTVSLSKLTNLTVTVMANYLSDYCIITELAVLKIYPEC